MQPACSKQLIFPRAMYRLKSVRYFGRTLPILLQNENGPCPLIAIANVLLLRGHLTIHTDYSHFSNEELIALLAEYLLSRKPALQTVEQHADYEQNIHDAISLLPRLQFGLDVNVKFKSVTDFEFTKELVLFDMLGITLVHGWLASPEDVETHSIICALSYNQLQEKLIALHSYSGTAAAASEAQQREGQIITHFLETTASQLTYTGLYELHQKLKEDELCVLFRNNHFSTLTRHGGELYVLVTDLGYVEQPWIVWEKLSEIDGDTVFVNDEFRVYHPPPAVAALPHDGGTAAAAVAHEHDYLYALQLQQKEQEEAHNLAIQAALAEPEPEPEVVKEGNTKQPKKQKEGKRELSEFRRALEQEREERERQLQEQHQKRLHNEGYDEDDRRRARDDGNGCALF